jgi:DNA polymerase III subunit chi
MRVDFYYLTRLPLERTLPRVAERVLADGGRLLVVSADAAQREAIDRLLWDYAPDSFLPHAQLGAGDDAVQPVLIAPDVDAANRARNVALVDGRWRDEAFDFDRAFHFFDDGSIGPARTAWKTVAARDGVRCHYWKVNDAGRWEEATPVANRRRDG